jgi:hypothetical protein
MWLSPGHLRQGAGRIRDETKDSLAIDGFGVPGNGDFVTMHA